MALNVRHGLIAFATSVLLACNVFAQGINKQSAAVEAEAISTVFAFNRICYAQVPDIEAIGQMAKDLIWRPVKKADLKAFETVGKAEILDGWDAQIGQRVYRVAVSQGPILQSQIGSFPEFKNGKATICTLVLDGLDDPVEIAADMQKLANKAPVSKDVRNGDLLSTTWAGGNDELKVFLVSSLGGQKGGFLSVTVLTK